MSARISSRFQREARALAGILAPCLPLNRRASKGQLKFTLGLFHSSE